MTTQARSDRRIKARVVLAYLAFSVIWIVASDRIVELLSGSAAQVSQFQSIKGLLFVTASAALIYALLRRELAARRAAESEKLELAAARDRAQAADRLKSVFLATMSHELRTPLNSVIGFTGILLQELPGKINDEQRKQLGMIRTSARHLLALINDVLDLSKIEAGQLDLELSPFDVRASIDSVVGAVTQSASEKGLILEARVDSDVGELVGDRRRLEQVLLNLVGNAIKFTDNGHVVIEARRVGSHGLEVSVSDTGIGISDQDQRALFQPFHQLDGGASRRYDGTGLGLSISQRLAGLMGGTIRVVSELGKGSTFVVRLPAPAASKETT